MPELTCRLPWMTALLLIVGTCVGGSLPAQGSSGFDAARAFCDRQTFELESLNEVKPWLDYVSGLRTGRSTPPGDDCASTTARAIVGVVASQTLEEAEAKREAFHGFYTAKALLPDSSERAEDTDGSFRYRNDVTLAGFVWFLCPGTGEDRRACVRETVSRFPDAFTRTRPVFCDFASSDAANVERVAARADLPLECFGSPAGAPEGWMERTANVLGE